jgi:hypothetical protein
VGPGVAYARAISSVLNWQAIRIGALLELIAMRTLLNLAIMVGVLWAFDAYEYNGLYRYAVLHQIEQTVGNFSRAANNLMLGRGG